MPSSVLQQKTPNELLYVQEPSYNHLKVYGYLCFVSTPKHNRDKFAPQGNPCVFLSCPYGKKAYKLYDLTTKKILSSRDFHFYETYFPFHHLKELSSTSPLPPPIFLHYDDFTSPFESTPSSSSPSSTLSTNLDSPPLNFPHASSLPSPISHNSPSLSPPQNSSPAPLSSLEHFPTLRRAARPHRKPTHLQNHICSSVVSSSTSDPFNAFALSHFYSVVQFHHLPLTFPVHSNALLSFHELTS